MKSNRACQLEKQLTSCRIALLLIIAITYGCASNPAIYPGPRRPAEEVATIVAGRGLTFLKINKRMLGENEYELLPSTYTVEFKALVRGEELGEDCQFFEGQRVGLYCKVTLKALAGHTYKFSRGEREDGGRSRNVGGVATFHRFQVYITDTAEDGESWAVTDKCDWG